MHSEFPPHEKIRFRRGDIACLDAFPSAVPPERQSALRAAPRRVLTAALGIVAALAVLAACVVVAVVLGVGDERLRSEAETALAGLTGEGMTTRIGDAGMTFDGFGGLALEVNDTAFGPDGEASDAVQIGSTRFGLRFAPLLRGAIDIGRVSIGNARVDLGALPRSQGLPVFDERGLFDADAAGQAIFAALEKAVGALDEVGVDTIHLETIEIVLPGNGRASPIHIGNAVLQRGADRAVTLSASLEAGARPVTLEGEARIAGDGSVEAVDIRLEAPMAEEEPVDGLLGAVTMTLRGVREAQGGRFTLSGKVADARLPLGRKGMRADIALGATAAHGAGKIEIDRLNIVSGRSTWNFNGAVGPVPVSEGGSADGSYRFELVSDGSTVAPVESPEPALSVLARIAGRFDALGRRFEIEEIGARTGTGEVRGEAVVTREPGSTPGVTFSLDAEQVPVSHAKQLWPPFSAPPARRWVLANVFGGRVETGHIEMSVPPGRLGNGVPLGPDEVWGNFVIRGTRFDVAGRIPPVRDGNGAVDFRGTDVDITLDGGRAYSPAGRIVDASSGRLTIRNAHVKPVIGKLSIDVDGTADAVMELASYDPVAVGRFIDLKPRDLSGDVSGTVVADIPLQRGIPVESLDWRIDLDYENLAIAREFEGQNVSQAKGSIVVDPAKAVIEAEARLNDMPATVHLVEPLGSDKSGRERHVALQTDDDAREAIAPGLDRLLSGPAQVELDDASKEGPRDITIGLDRATLSIPWVGWSKGAGVPATAAFTMKSDGERMALSDFRLDGETFGATGALSFAGGALQSARFPMARLNRGDDFSVDVEARGRGYAVTVRGNSIDVRSAVKLHLKEPDGAGGALGAQTPVTLDLQVASMTGFHGETLSDVKLSYSGSGGRTDRLELSAVTDSGRPVAFTDVRDGDARNVAMNSTDAGSVLRFLDIYEHMEGGSIELSLSGSGDGPLSGRVDARDFWIVNEPRLSSIVSTPPQGDGRSLNQAVRGEIDTSRVHFERGFSRIARGAGSLVLDRGVLRGPMIGMSFQGTLYDGNGNIDLTGTFMPAYGLNRIFGEIPLIGQILGNGRDRGLIGITFRLAGKADEPQLQVNPLSVIAPGIFRSVFEFR